MSYSYERVERRRGIGANGSRSTLGYWVPLVVSITAVSIGFAAWIWNERSEDDDTSSSDSDKAKISGSRRANASTDAGASLPQGSARDYYGAEDASSQQRDDGGIVSRMSGALRRSPSPQQILDGAGKKVAAGIAAAGAVVGGALTSIREEDHDAYADHSRWSQEASAQRRHDRTDQTATGGARDMKTSYTSPLTRPDSNIRRKTVAIVISADSNLGDDNSDIHASVLSYLPSHLSATYSKLYILIYSPDLKQHPLSVSESSRPLGSRTSSFSNIGHEDVRTPGDELDRPLSLVDPNPLGSSSSGVNTPNTPALSASAPAGFNTLYSQAQRMVEKENMVLPFTTPTGFVQLLRHLSPDIVYLQESLSGPGGEIVASMRSWVSQILVVVGAEGGHGGLVDTEDEDDRPKDTWWRDSSMIGVGKGVEIVDGIRLGEDWSRRVEGQD